MIYQSFDYVQADSLNSAVNLLANDPQAVVIAGGQELTRQLKLERVSPSKVVGLGSLVDLRKISRSDGEIGLGSMATLREIATCTDLRAYEVLVQAAKATLDAQACNSTTIGGCLASGQPESHLAAAILVLDATINVQGIKGIRRIPAGEFFLGVGKTALEQSEIITSVSFAEVQGASAYECILHPVSSAPLCGVAANYFISQDMASRGIRLALTGASESPIRLGAVESYFEKNASLERAFDDFDESKKWFSSRLASGEYRAHLAKTLTRRVVARLTSNT